jgi:exodeoxyribonuclease V alpha subunit
LVDEASMVDLYLMAHLLRALHPRASLLLLGDSDQLESVEAGGVLAELVRRGSVAPLPAQAARTAARLGTYAEPKLGLPLTLGTSDTPLPGMVVSLHHSYRAKQSPWILELGALAKPGAPSTVSQFIACCRQNEPHIRLHGNRRALLTVCRNCWADAQRVTSSWSLTQLPDVTAITKVLKRFQLLCGDNGQVERANRLGVAGLWAGTARRTGLGLPHGCPVLVTQNRTVLGLSNGDVGIAIAATAGHPAQVVVFPGVSSPIPIVQLPMHQPAFALTIHKSQGSEWEKVAIDLPSDSDVLDRNLLYTAISRSSGTLDIYADSERALAAILAGSPV